MLLLAACAAVSTPPVERVPADSRPAEATESGSPPADTVDTPGTEETAKESSADTAPDTDTGEPSPCLDPAAADCPVGTGPLVALECASGIAGHLTSGSSSVLGSSGGPYACGEPYDSIGQLGPEDAWLFRCQADGPVVVNLEDLQCDLDLYVLGSSCSHADDCIAGDTDVGVSDLQVTFPCVFGATYVLVVEGYGFSQLQGQDPCTDDSMGTYTLKFETGAGGCLEDCGDGVDNDADGAKDCADLDCAWSSACGC